MGTRNLDDGAGFGSTTREPEVMLLSTVRRAIHESPGAISRRNVGSMSSTRARL
jgi:hypothetical protein